MPSLRSRIKRLCYSGALSSKDRKRILNALDQAKGWIPVSKQLPDSPAKVLVTRKNAFGEVIDIGRYTGDGWLDGFVTMPGVIAWMPLPSPYTEREEEISRWM